MSKAKTIREAVIEATRYGSDYWIGKLEHGSSMHRACVKNSIGLNAWAAVGDRITMRMCVKYPGYGKTHALVQTFGA